MAQSRAKRVPITPEVLTWAISHSGLESEEIISRMKIDADQLDRWQSGDEQPGLTEFHRLAQILKRQAATFLLPGRPSIDQPVVDFRRPPDSERSQPNRKELRYLREASRLQKALSWIQKEVDTPLIDIPSISRTIDPQRAASQLRAFMGVDAQQQVAWQTPAKAFQGWRGLLESAGIYVFLFPMGKESCRGFSLWDDFAPLIAINTHWKYEARIFTAFHELGHLATRSNSFCLSPSRQLFLDGGDAQERWCERFAAAFLLPWEEVRRSMETRLGWSVGKVITNLDDLRVVARTFKVSLRAAAIRLIENGAAEWNLYQSIPDWSDDKSGGGGGGRARKEIRESEYGQRTIAQFAIALGQELMTRRDVLSYLEVSDRDLYKIQDRTTQG